MAAPKKIRIMISSRCEDKITYKGSMQKLSVLRQDLKKELEAEKLFGEQAFDVWINEDAEAAAGSESSWTECEKQVNQADLVLVIYTGNAGWIKKGHDGDIGICHAELLTVMSKTPGKARCVLFEHSELPMPTEDVHKRFQDYYNKISLFRSKAISVEELFKEVKKAIREASIELVHLGVRESSRNRFITGDALNWTRMSFDERSEAIKSVITKALLESYKGSKSSGEGLILHLTGKKVFLAIHGVAAAMSNSFARESIGQPFAKDHERLSDLKKDVIGPVHIIGCHKGVTESQAAKVLGLNEIMTVDGPFGIYIADPIMKIQMIFLENCRDETTTRHAIQRLMEWFEQTDEIVELIARAGSRKKIVEAIAAEV